MAAAEELDISGRILEVKLGSRKVNDVRWSPAMSAGSGARLAAASSSGKVHMLTSTSERSKPKDIVEFSSHSASAHCVEFFLTDTTASVLLSGGDDSRLNLFDAREHSSPCVGSAPTGGDTRSLSVSPCGTYAAIATREDDCLEVHDLRNLRGASADSYSDGQLPSRIGSCSLQPKELHEVLFGSSESGIIWCATGGGTCDAYRTRFGDMVEEPLECIGNLHAHSSSVTRIACSADRSLYAMGSADCAISLWDMSTCMQKENLFRHERPVDDLRISADGTGIVSAASESDRMSVIDVYDCAHDRTIISTKRNKAEAVDISPGARAVALVDNSGSLSVLPLPSASTL
jgi:WD40 repeat protein